MAVRRRVCTRLNAFVNRIRAESGSRWTPAQLSGLVATLSPALSRSSGRLWQNTAKTIPAVSDGDPVRVAVCPFTSVEFTAPTDSARPLLWDEGGGKWSLWWDGIDDSLRSTASPVGATTIAFRFTNVTSIASTTRIISSNTINALIQPRRSGDGNPFFVGGTVRNTVWVNDTLTHTTIARKTGGGGFWTLRSDSVDLSVSASISTDFGQVCIGTVVTSTETFSGRIGPLIVTNSNVSGDDLAKLETYLEGLL